MAYDKVVDSAKLDAALTATADAIRTKGGGSEKIAWDAESGFADAVSEIAGSEPIVFVLGDGSEIPLDEIGSIKTDQGGILQVKTESGTVLWDATSNYDAVLNNNSWERISEASQLGIASAIWSVGDRKAVTVSGTVGTEYISGTYYVYIIGFNHNGAVNSIDFGTFKTALSGGVDVCLTDSKYDDFVYDGAKYFSVNHNSSDNTGGWKGCDVRYDILGSTNALGADAATTTAVSPVSGTLMAALPADLRAVMKPMTIYTDNKGAYSSAADCVSATVDYLPLLSEFEIYGTIESGHPTEQNYQTQYAYYAAGNSRVKYKHNAASTEARWYTRCAEPNSASFWVYASKYGFSSSCQANLSYGIAPIFRV